jgi:hypothetical protein
MLLQDDVDELVYGLDPAVGREAQVVRPREKVHVEPSASRSL